MLHRSNIPALAEFEFAPQDLSVFDEYLDYYGMHFSKTLTAQNIQHQLGKKSFAGFDIAVHWFSQTHAKGNVIVNHGYMDHSGLYRHLVQFLLQQGFNVLIYDLPGHGLSSGERAGIASFQCYQAVLKQLLAFAAPQLQGSNYLLGQSTGAAIAMDFVLHKPQLRIEKVILLAPLVIPKRWMSIRCALFFSRYWLTQVRRTFSINSSDQAFLTFIAEHDPLQTRFIKSSWLNALEKWQSHFDHAQKTDTPTLLIQGERDATVEWRYNIAAIEQHFMQLDMQLLDDASHHLVNESEAIRTRVFEDIRAFLA